MEIFIRVRCERKKMCVTPPEILKAHGRKRHNNTRVSCMAIISSDKACSADGNAEFGNENWYARLIVRSEATLSELSFWAIITFLTESIHWVCACVCNEAKREIKH